MEGFDFASPADASTLACIKQSGDFIVRYLTNNDATNVWKQLTKTEAAAALAAGLGIGLVYETYGDRAAYFTNAQGVIDITEAKKRCYELGVPGDVPVFFAVDFNPANIGEMNMVLDYFKGLASIGGRYVGVYGSFAVCKYLKAQLGVWPLWQTYAWSAGQWLDGVDLQQYQNGQTVCGHEVDRNHCFNPKVLWMPPFNFQRDLSFGGSDAEGKALRFTKKDGSAVWYVRTDVITDVLPK